MRRTKEIADYARDILRRERNGSRSRTAGRARGLRVACLALTLGGLVVLGDPWPRETPEAHALPKLDLPGLEGGGLAAVCNDPPDIQPVPELIGTPRIVGYPVVGFTVEIDAQQVKFRWRTFCGSDFIHPLDEYEWSVVSRPDTSSTSLTRTDTLAPRLRLDREGQFVVRLTACPDGCTLVVPGPDAEVQSLVIDVPIQALTSAPLAPETMPVRPMVQPTLRTPQTVNHCSFGAGVISSQWYAVAQIEGPGDYPLLEGRVQTSRVSRRDTPMNHDSQDVNFHVAPDEAFQHLLFEGSEESTIEVEWETGRFPESYRPTVADRVSVFGHWIYDCGHGKKAEIHPPVGVAVHRARPISIPSTHLFAELGNQPAGSGVYVPGIITDVFFSTRGGRLLDCSVDTGLKNADFEIRDTSQGPLAFPTCVPAPSLDRAFEFNIYLPPNPQVTMARAGFTVPPVPLYVAESSPNGSPGPSPTFQRVDTAEGITYLKARVHLQGWGASGYVRRIVAGWVLPSTDNWGLDRWRLLLHRLNITNDGDGDARGDGDWRLWVNTNNAATDGSHPFFPQEWVRILNRDAHGVEDFGGVPWETSLDTPLSLGPELLRYPPPGPRPSPRDYGILFHTTGYEADGALDDDAGTISVFVPAAPVLYHWPNSCSPSNVVDGLYYSGCVQYTADFEIVPGTPLPDANPGPAARALASKYVLTCPRGRGGDDVGVCEGVLARPVELPIVHPLDILLEPGSGPVDVTGIGPFRPGEPELALTEISTEDFYEIVDQNRLTDPKRIERLLVSLRELIDGMRKDPSLAEDADAELDVLRLSLPRNLWARHFADLPSGPADPRLPKARFTGSATLSSTSGPVRARELVLHCAAQRRPNRLSLQWGSNRFDLDLVFEARCNTGLSRGSSFAGLAFHQGRGMGRYNGKPGAVIDWRFTDGGEGGGAGDSATVTIRRAGSRMLLLQASGDITGGDFQAHEW